MPNDTIPPFGPDALVDLGSGRFTSPQGPARLRRTFDVFLHELSPEQRRAFLVLTRQVIDADRRLAI